MDSDQTRFHELLPDSGMNLVFRYSATGCRMVLFGPRTQKSSVEIHQGSAFFGVRFITGQALRLADASGPKLLDTFVELTHLGGQKVEDVARQLLATDDFAKRQLAMLDLLRGLDPMVPDQRCRRAAALVEDRHGQMSVGELARQAALHPRTLERLFAGHIGLSPKRLLRLARISHLGQCLRSGAHATLADLAQACGYTDQSHMTGDFRRLTGNVPTDINLGHTGEVRGEPCTDVIHRYRT